MLDPLIIARMNPERRKIMSQQGNRARELIRLSQEPPEYMPIDLCDFKRFVIIGDVSYDKPRIVTGLFFDAGHTGRYELLINGRTEGVPAGWYNGIHKLAERLPSPRATY
jgi:hypothetical protein